MLKHKKKQAQKLAKIFMVMGAVYLCLAYIILPLFWDHYEHQPSLQSAPRITYTANHIPGDPLNIAIYASEEELISAYLKAHFSQASALDLRDDVRIGISVVFDRPDPTAPVSNLFLWNRKQDLAFEQEDGQSADHRHHVRFWKSTQTAEDGRPLWLGSASFDKGSGLSHLTGQITHHIDANIDAERDYDLHSLLEAHQVVKWYQVTGIGPTLNGRNGGGDRYFSDGEMTVIVLNLKNEETSQAMHLPSPVLVRTKNKIFANLRSWFN